MSEKKHNFKVFLKNSSRMFSLLYALKYESSFSYEFLNVKHRLTRRKRKGKRVGGRRRMREEVEKEGGKQSPFLVTNSLIICVSWINGGITDLS